MIAGASLLTIASCSGGSSGQSGGATTIRYGHWDNGLAQSTYAQLFEDFMAANEDANVDQEFASFNDFQERMTTQIAGGTVPNIFWIAAPQVITYHSQGLYRDLSGLPHFDYDQYDEETLERIRIDGELNTLPMGISIPSLRYNATYLDEDGAALPDYESEWTWDNLAEFLIDYTNNASEDRRGILYSPGHDLAFEGWLRQQGEDLWTEDRQLGASVDGFASWMDWWERLRKAGATVAVEEQGGISPSWTEFGHRALFAIGNQNHILEAAPVFPDSEFEQRTLPANADAAEGHSFGYFVRLAVYESTPESMMDSIGRLLDFNLNDPDWMTTLGPVMGAPVSASQMDAAREDSDPNVQQVIQVTDDTFAKPMRPRHDAPPGSSTWRLEFDRALEQLALGSKTIQEAAEDAHKGIQAGLG